MCIYIYSLNKKSKNKSYRGVRNSTDRPKIWRVRLMGYRNNFQRLMHVILHTSKI